MKPANAAIIFEKTETKIVSVIFEAITRSKEYTSTRSNLSIGTILLLQTQYCTITDQNCA